jgi:drug/metabolite transporter (DMT)-like permease
MTTSANASLLNNFEIVATSLIALLIFKESISKRLWGAIVLITISSIILSVKDLSSFSFSFGSIFVLIACTCWGIENNCTRKLSVKDPLEIVVIKGFCSGIGCLLIAFALGEQTNNIPYIITALILGFFAYGLGISFYIYAQRDLGAARTSAYYAIAPFIGVGLSLIIFREIPTFSFVIALIIMIIGTYFASTEKHDHRHSHTVISHEHSHSSDDGHHSHIHDKTIIGKHNHIHTHEEYTHSHKHTQDIHHSHAH